MDIGLPGIDGIEATRRIRTWSEVPIIVLSVREAHADKVAALDAGADDYVTKPFAIEEVLARIRAVSRRTGAPHMAEPVVAFGDLQVDLGKRLVRRGGEDVHLTANRVPAAGGLRDATPASCSPIGGSCSGCGEPATGTRATTSGSTSPG